MSIAMKLAYTVDLNAPLVTLHIGTLLMEDDNKANTLIVTVKEGGQNANLTGIVGAAYFLRADGYEVYRTGTNSGNVVTIPLHGDCYGFPGDFVVRVLLENTAQGESRTILRLTGVVEGNGNGTLTDPDNVIHNIGQIQANEGMRISNETSRVRAESGRVLAESGRVSAENTRVSNENARQSAETSRASAETTRESNETNRISAESERVSSEAERDSAEDTRQNNESYREIAEAARETAEEERESNETTRQIAEDMRETQEETRELAETGRFDAETSRVSAEEARANAETERQEEIAKVSGMTVSETSVNYGTTPQATLTEENGVKHLALQVERGPQGRAYTILGSAYATLAALEADITFPAVGDQYNVGNAVPYNVYRWTGAAWENQGVMQGPKGDAGTSPAVTTSKTGKVTTVTITDADGDHIVTIDDGENGIDGSNGATFTPSVDADGNLSWTNDKEMENPSPTNIKGPPGNPGNPGTPGDTGPGVPAGGTVGQVLKKAGATDFDTEWTDLPPWVLSIDTTTGKLTLTYTGATI